MTLAGTERLVDLKNLGARSAPLLEAIGVRTPEQLDEIGSVEAYRRLRAAFPDRVTLNYLYALEGALLGVVFTDLPPEHRAELRRAAEASQPAEGGARG